MRFDELYLSDDILDAIDSMHFDKCTPIQEHAIPAIIDRHDLIAIAQTGTGKTAAYLVPIIDEIANGDYSRDNINCVIMSPTRELAQQIDRQMQGFSYFMDVSSIAVYGGTDGYTYEQQRKGLKAGADVVIATPGRLLAHIQMGSVDLSKVSFFVLDEADRMLDMGFFDDIMSIVKQLPKERQTLLFSATMPAKIKQLANQILVDPVEVKLGVAKPADKIDQSAYLCFETKKQALLEHIISQHQDASRIIVFADSKIKVKQLAAALRKRKLNVGEMHSDLEQKQRDDVMLDFKVGKVSILVATDIVARGIDIDDISIVVNYDVPSEAEDYVHRIGRTARADADGIAITFISDKDIPRFQKIERVLKSTIRKNALPDGFGDAPVYKESSGKPRRSNHRGRRSNVKNGKSSNSKPKQSAHKQDKVIENSESQQPKKKRNRRRHRSRKSTDAKTIPENKA